MREVGTGCAGAIAFWLVLVILMLCFAGCKTRMVVVETVRTDTTYITKQQRDSIWLHDSIFMHEYQNGDTVFMLRDRWHTKYIESIKHDTTYIAKTDSVPVPYPRRGQSAARTQLVAESIAAHRRHRAHPATRVDWATIMENLHKKILLIFFNI